MKAKKAILFDAGGTLLRFEPGRAEMIMSRCAQIGVSLDEALAARAVAASELWMGETIAKENAGAPRLSDEELTRGLDSAMAGIIRPDGPAALADKLAAIPWAEQKARPFPDAHQTLRALLKKGYSLAVVSNWSAALAGVLDELELTAYFERVIISEVEGVSKPDPRLMLIAAERMGVDPADCVYVGDHPFDVLCAKEAGFDVVWVAPADERLPDSVPYTEDARVQTLSQLLPLFDAGEGAP